MFSMGSQSGVAEPGPAPEPDAAERRSTHSVAGNAAARSHAGSAASATSTPPASQGTMLGQASEKLYNSVYRPPVRQEFLMQSSLSILKDPHDLHTGDAVAESRCVRLRQPLKVVFLVFVLRSLYSVLEQDDALGILKDLINKLHMSVATR